MGFSGCPGRKGEGNEPEGTTSWRFSSGSWISGFCVAKTTFTCVAAIVAWYSAGRLIESRETVRERYREEIWKECDDSVGMCGIYEVARDLG